MQIPVSAVFWGLFALIVVVILVGAALLRRWYLGYPLLGPPICIRYAWEGLKAPGDLRYTGTMRIQVMGASGKLEVQKATVTAPRSRETPKRMGLPKPHGRLLHQPESMKPTGGGLESNG
ncbi:hypothetical protein K432DRAFT_422968 [Lepidopterella palustris CBS 459.81]|uniref:Uncharacterized protein n=1 Tax=Lepidopterella palustris CBS 459.81 TaxID=1314670 RepID=A0A8E2EH85_9PEZI|nr:hypothetical protein K432DRAFT_422968 [Lepidopterella palustris CBS 459.81]